MANVRVQDLLRNEQKKNHVSCMIALQKTGEAVLPFTEGKLQQVHQQISQQLGNQNPCQQLCSRNKRDVNRWCITCGLWRQALIGFYTNPWEPIWRKLQSWKWPKHHMNLVEVFMLQNWDKANMDPNDLSVALTVWKKCSVFPATILPLADELRNSRNTVAHTTSLDENVKLTVFNDIKKVIHHADVVNYLPNPLEIQNIITDLENGDLFKFENELKEIMNNTNELKDRLRTILWILKAACIVILAIALWYMQPGLALIFTRPQIKPAMEKTGCLQEYSPLFSTSTMLVDYFKHHKPLVGRVWMFQLLDEQLKNTTKNGILLEADMGYGKSAIAAHITCAKEGDQGMKMRKRLIAFHVCKFDVKQTHDAGVFIQRLVSMISNNIPEFNDTINEECLHSFITGKCDSDPFGCIDECIIFPLQRTNISDGSEEYRLIIIDALDECHETFSFEKSNKIFNLMERRANMLPSWIKLLVTSRRLPRNERLKYNLDRTYFHNLETRNLNDIDLYFNQSFREKNVTIFQLAVNDVYTKPNQISNLRRYYQDQFDRWYDHGFDFSKSILEALVTTYLKKTPENIRNVISSNAVDNLSLSMFEKELSIIQQFTNIINGEIEFKHFSLFKWLEEECPDEKFRLSLSNGHQANAHYILHELNTSNFTFDVTDLLLHIQSANEGLDLREQFMNLPKNVISRMEEKFLEDPVVRIIKKGTMKEIPEILFHHFPGGNHFSAENISVGFIAAENGYTYALKQLVNHGADIHFRMPMFTNILTMNDAVEIATNFKHWKYGLLDIAAQHGHTETVKLFLHDDLFSSYNLYERNGLNLLPWHLACMFNRIEVVEVFLQFNRSFVDWKCLYFAAEKGNIEILKLLLDAGIYDECVLCTNELYWIPNGTARIQGNMVPENDSMYVLFDDWSELSCESAFHAAIRQNHLNVVRELLKDSKHSTLHCLDRGGRPPVIAALQSNRTDMAVLCFKRNTAHKIKIQCQDVQMLTDSIQLHPAELMKLNNMKCKAGHGIEHAISPMSVVSQNIFDHTNLDFNRRDEDNCLPIHYAACGNNVEYLHFLLQRHEMFGTPLCFNNTNAFHSTIHCRAFDTFIYFVSHFEKLVNYFNAESFQEYLWYLLTLSNNDGQYAQYAMDKNTWNEMFKIIIEKFHVDISMMSDESGKNILHYIVKNGHFKLLSYLVSNKRSVTLDLLQRGAFIRQSQILYLAAYLPKRKQLRTEIISENFWASPHSVQQEMKKLSPSEYCFSLLSRFFNRYGVFKIEDKIAILQNLLRKKSYNLVDIYLKHIMSRETIFNTNVFATILDFDNTGYVTTKYLLFVLHDIQMQQTIELKRYEFLMCSTCQRLRNNCLAHKLTRKISRFQGNLNSHFGNIYATTCLSVFKLMISFTDRRILSSCVDQQGLNVLELAIYSKSEMLMKLLMDKGVETYISPEKLILRSYKQNDDIEKLPVTLLNTTSVTFSGLVDYHFLTYKQIIKIFNTTTATTNGIQGNSELLVLMIWNNVTFFENPFFFPGRNDHFYAKFIDIHFKRIPEYFVCKQFSANFSLIHLLSLHGYSISIETCVKYFGKGILTCLNIDHITPLYLSRVYDTTNKTFDTILENIEDKQLVFPKIKAEKNFVYNLVTKFYFSIDDNRKMLCFLRYINRPQMSLFKTIKQYKCLKSITKDILKTDNLKSLMKKLNFAIKYRSFAELRRSFLEKMKYLALLFWVNSSEKALVSFSDFDNAYDFRLNTMALKRFMCIQFMYILKVRLNDQNITAAQDTYTDCQGKTSTLSEFEKYLIRLALSKRFEDLCTHNIDTIESDLFGSRCFANIVFDSKRVYQQFYFISNKYFQKLFLSTVYLQSHTFQYPFVAQRFREIFRNVNDFKMFSDNAIYKYKYMEAIRSLPLVKFSSRYTLTDIFEYQRKLSPNFDYINSSRSSELIRNVYSKLKNAHDNEN